MFQAQLHENCTATPGIQAQASIGQLFRLAKFPQKFHGTGHYQLLLCALRDAFKQSIESYITFLRPGEKFVEPRYEYHGSGPVNETMLHSDCDLVLKTPLSTNDGMHLSTWIKADPGLQMFSPRQNNAISASNVFTFTIQCKVGLPIVEVDITVLSDETRDGLTLGVGNYMECKHFAGHTTEYIRDVYSRLYNTERWGLNLTSAIYLCRTVGLPHYPLVIFADHFADTFFLGPNDAAYTNAIIAHFFAFMLNTVKDKFSQPDNFFSCWPKMREITETQWQSIRDQLFPDDLLNPILCDFVQLDDDVRYEAITVQYPVISGRKTTNITNFVEAQKNCIVKLLCEYIYFGKGKFDHVRLSIVPSNLANEMVKFNNKNPTFCGPVFKRLHKLGGSTVENASSYAEIADFITKFQRWAGRSDI